MTATKGAILVLADGRCFPGAALGAAGTARGEVVFTTGMAGYQETLTDPSFAGQIVTFTYPHIGSHGFNDDDSESDRVYAAGAVIRDPVLEPSSHRAQDDLGAYLRGARIPTITGIDTRALTRHIRSAGAMPGLVHGPFDPDAADAAAALDRLRNEAASLPSMAGRDLAHEVSCSSLYTFELDGADAAPARPGPHVVVVDYGVKRNILRSLATRGAKVTVVPATSSADDILALRPAGILLSNGPGDPDAVTGAAPTVARLLGRVPIMGICLGCQILALAAGAHTYKLKFGHRGVNQPVQRAGSHRVFITSQNHGFAVDPETLPQDAAVTFTNPNDGTLEGFDLPALDASAVQFHPEACPGPRDTAFLFDDFVAKVS